MKYIKRFDEALPYNTYISSSGANFPNVSFVDEGSAVYFNRRSSDIIKAGDIIFLNNNEELYVCDKNDWNTSLGLAQGVVVVPSNHTPDETVRIMSLKAMNYSNPEQGGANQGIMWGGYNVNLAGLTDYTLVPTTSNDSSTTKGASSWSRLPSNSTNGNFTGDTCYTDPGTRYYNTSEAMCPSPYLEDGTQNPDYIENSSSSALAGKNACSDFRGRLNTAVICDAATGQTDWETASAITNSSGMGFYPAACCCRRYHTVGIAKGEWYLPAAGELGYMMPRFAEIQGALSTLSSQGAVLLNTAAYYWSSSEYSATDARGVNSSSGNVNYASKYSYGYVRAFASVPLARLRFL